jgi:hypothetical protein
MSRVLIRPGTQLLSLVLVGIAMQVSGCASDSYAAKGAGQGATTGALAGAVGGMATALIFGGNVGEAAARGAVYGGSSGAVVGGMSGANVDKQVAAQEQAERDKRIAEFRDEIGTDAFNGFVALAECKHDIAVANAREARKSRNRDHALAGLWIEVLAEADRNNPDSAGELMPELVSSDKGIETVSEAESRTEIALGEIKKIRAEYDLPQDCPS